MCEHCLVEKVWAEPIGDEEQEQCEYDSEGEECTALASYLISDRHVEHHLCQEHVDLANDLLDKGLGPFLRAAGVQQSVDYLPVGPGEVCDHIAPGSLEACGNQATHAEMLTSILAFACERHNPEFGVRLG